SSLFRGLGRARRVVLAGLRRNRVLLGSPAAQVRHAAALAAERPPAVRGRKFRRLAAGGAWDGARGNRVHRLQNVRSNGTSCSYTRVRCTPSGSRKRTLSAYLFALISGTHGSSSASESRSI